MYPLRQPNTFGVIHPDLIAAQKFAYAPVGMTYQKLVKEAEGAEYGACVFEMNNRRIKFRAGKVTPTKIGLFVTLWKRIGRGAIIPHEIEDPVDLFVVSVRHSEHFGQFVFPKAILFERASYQGKETEESERCESIRHGTCPTADRLRTHKHGN